MEYSFSAKRKQGYIHIKVRGDNDVDTIRRWMNDGLKACVEGKCSSALVEVNLEGKSISISDAFFAVTDARKLAWSSVTTLAYIDRNPEHSDMLPFIEAVATKRGLNMKLCKTIKEAQAWIAEQRSFGTRE